MTILPSSWIAISDILLRTRKVGADPAIAAEGLVERPVRVVAASAERAAPLKWLRSPATTILPSSWTATSKATSVPGPRSVNTLPSPLNVVSSVRPVKYRATKILPPAPPTTTTLPSSWTATPNAGSYVGLGLATSRPSPLHDRSRSPATADAGDAVATTVIQARTVRAAVGTWCAHRAPPVRACQKPFPHSVTTLTERVPAVRRRVERGARDSGTRPGGGSSCPVVSALQPGRSGLRS